jgi:hypothetical protein
MSLLDIARRDAQRIINSNKFGFSSSVTLIDQAGVEYPINAIVSVIHNLVDPDTGQPVSGSLATASINTLDLIALGVQIPEGEADETKKPWLIREADIQGNTVTYAIVRSAPDKANGNILCDLNEYVY